MTPHERSVAGGLARARQFTPESQRAAARARALTLTSEHQRMAARIGNARRDMSEMARRSHVVQAERRRGHPNAGERRVAELLEELGVVYEREYQVWRYFVDVAVVDARKVIEVNGHYWHNREDKKAHDAERLGYLVGQGWTVLVVDHDKVDSEAIREFVNGRS